MSGRWPIAVRRRRVAGVVATLVAAAIVGACGSPPRASDAASPLRAAALPRLISTDELAARVARGDATLIDARGDLGAYLRAHLPGAVHLNTESLRAVDGGVPNLLLPAASYRTIFSRLGVRMDRDVVVYSAGDPRNFDATYVAWILAGLGHSGVLVLDGGFGKWELEQRETARTYPRGATSEMVPARWGPERATLDDVRAALGRREIVLVDARVPEQYAGSAGPQMRRGHIPGAINHYWQSDLTTDALARVWRPVDELRATYTAQGITPDREIIVYCNGGLESSHVHFTLRSLLGYPRVRVYDGSFTEWAEKVELPVETGPAR